MSDQNGARTRAFDVRGIVNRAHTAVLIISTTRDRMGLTIDIYFTGISVVEDGAENLWAQLGVLRQNKRHHAICL
eukprot:5532464-Prorocentrum_lima.AAC.1